MLLLEIARTTEKERAALNLLPKEQSIDTESEEMQRRIETLKGCLATLSERSRKLITQYYEGDGAGKIKKRKELAVSLGLPLNALRIRACRLREKLETCMGRYLAGHI